MKKTASAIIILGLIVSPCLATPGYEDLAKLVKSGTNEDVLIAFIDSYNSKFALTPDNIVQLKNLGATDKAIKAAIEHKAPSVDSSIEKTASAATCQAGANAPTTASSQQQAPPTTVVYQTVPSTGGWVWVDGDWYWQYPSGVIVDLGWRPYYFHHHFYHGGFYHGPYHHGFGGWGRHR